MPAFLSRCDVIDAEFHVCLRGTHGDDVVPIEAALEPEIVSEIDGIVRNHDFSKQPIATGLLGNHLRWRMSRLDGAYYALVLDRTNLVQQMRKFSKANGLSKAERVDLRFLVGGYDLAEVARRLDIAPADVRRRRRALLAKVGVTTRAHLFEELVHADSTPVRFKKSSGLSVSA